MATSRNLRMLLAAWTLLGMALVAQNPVFTTGMFNSTVPVPFPPLGWSGVGTVGDFNGDGHPDALYRDGFYLVAGDGQGGVLSATLIPAPVPTGDPFGIWDMDGNGLRDICTSSGNVHLNFGASGAPLQYSIPGAPSVLLDQRIAVADFDGDGVEEVVSICYGPTPQIRVHKLEFGQATLVFSDSFQTIGLFAPTTADFNGDGLLDFSVLELGPVWPAGQSSLNTRVRTYTQTASGSFIATSSAAISGFVNDAQAPTHSGDIDGDGRPDVVVVGRTPFGSAGGIAVARFLNTPTGFVPMPLFFPPTDVQQFANFLSGGGVISLQDFDGDGRAELMVVGARILRMDPAFEGAPFHMVDLTKGFLTNPGLLPCTTTCCSAMAGDMNLDGAPDVVFSCFVPGGVVATYSAISLNLGPHRPRCPGGPVLTLGTPTPGHGQFSIGVSSLFPGMPALLGVSVGESSVTWPGGCALGPDLDPAQRLLPFGSLGITMTDATGAASVAIPLPAAPSLFGATVYAQWLVQHPGPGAPFTIAGTPWSLSDSRRIVIW